ncbi:uncharacterized protein isoform X3 [Salmo salar]|uniref:Uncharacterized protein isoform X3 n=1 Tax=Salmo salar TaxID=8030 RepID=A0A1S3T6Y5_SALSA|nr:uncharacterized protein LOC106613978 isoform X3 [Salmo salar]
MEPQDRPQPGTMPRINRVRPGKGDVKVSVVNMCGPSSSTILRKIYQQTALSINSQYPVQRSKPWSYAPHLMGLAPVPVTPRPLLCSTRTSRGTEPTTPTTVASSVYSGGLQSDGGTASRNTTALSAPQNNKNTPVSL